MNKGIGFLIIKYKTFPSANEIYVWRTFGFINQNFRFFYKDFWSRIRSLVSFIFNNGKFDFFMILKKQDTREVTRYVFISFCLFIVIIIIVIINIIIIVVVIIIFIVIIIIIIIIIRIIIIIIILLKYHFDYY